MIEHVGVPVHCSRQLDLHKFVHVFFARYLDVEVWKSVGERSGMVSPVGVLIIVGVPNLGDRFWTVFPLASNWRTEWVARRDSLWYAYPWKIRTTFSPFPSDTTLAKSFSSPATLTNCAGLLNPKNVSCPVHKSHRCIPCRRGYLMIHRCSHSASIHSSRAFIRVTAVPWFCS